MTADEACPLPDFNGRKLTLQDQLVCFRKGIGVVGRLDVLRSLDTLAGNEVASVARQPLSPPPHTDRPHRTAVIGLRRIPGGAGRAPPPACHPISQCVGVRAWSAGAQPLW